MIVQYICTNPSAHCNWIFHTSAILSWCNKSLDLWFTNPMFYLLLYHIWLLYFFLFFFFRNFLRIIAAPVFQPQNLWSLDNCSTKCTTPPNHCNYSLYTSAIFPCATSHWIQNLELGITNPLIYLLFYIFILFFSFSNFIRIPVAARV